MCMRGSITQRDSIQPSPCHNRQQRFWSIKGSWLSSRQQPRVFEQSYVPWALIFDPFSRCLISTPSSTPPDLIPASARPFWTSPLLLSVFVPCLRTPCPLHAFVYKIFLYWLLSYMHGKLSKKYHARNTCNIITA